MLVNLHLINHLYRKLSHTCAPPLPPSPSGEYYRVHKALCSKIAAKVWDSAVLVVNPSLGFSSPSSQRTVMAPCVSNGMRSTCPPPFVSITNVALPITSSRCLLSSSIRVHSTCSGNSVPGFNSNVGLPVTKCKGGGRAGEGR